MRRLPLRRVFSTSIPRLRTKQAATAQEEGLTPEQLEQLRRDPPPPANFPVYCRPNAELRHLLKKIDLSVFQKNGLHNIPYRDQHKAHLAPLAFDGKTWPSDARIREIPLVESDTGDVVDVWTLQQRQAALEERRYVRYFDINWRTLSLLIRAIKWPEEMRLLPHIIREWHRRGLPVTKVDAGRIARKATQFDEMDVVFQMMQPEVYGLYYDIHGIREITRGMARRASRSSTGEKEEDVDKKIGIRPEDVLTRIPEVLNCSFAKDSKLVLRDPAIVGTQLWGFVWRFNNDVTYQTYEVLEEMFMLAERFIQLTLDSEIMAAESAIPLDESGRKFYVHEQKRHLIDYIPSINALRQLLGIISSPYRTVYNYLAKLENPNVQLRQLGGQLTSFIKGRVHTDSALTHIPTKTELTNPHYLGDTPCMRWAKLNAAVMQALKGGQVHARGMSRWQWAMFKGFTAPPDYMSAEMYYLPVRLWHVLHVLEGRATQWKALLKENGVIVRSEFNSPIVEYVVDLEQSEDTTWTDEAKEMDVGAVAGEQKEEVAETTTNQQPVEDQDDFVVEEITIGQETEADDEFTIAEDVGEERMSHSSRGG